MSARARNRREFLQGKSAADALAEAADRIGAVAPLDDPAQRPYLLHVARRAMACEFQLYFNAGQYPHATEQALAALDLVDELESQLTIYRDDSELQYVNRHAAERPVPVESRLFALLRTAATLHRETDGAYDITSGPLTKAWGFFRRQGKVPEAADLAEALARVGGQFVELDPATEAVRFARPGIELNLGSIGKGYALDRAAERLAAAEIGDFLLHGGQSSVVARGRQAARGESGGWFVGLRHPLRPGQGLAEIVLADAALGTSGSAVQFFRSGGRRYGHLLDPRTGWPAEGVLSSTVVAPTAALADALSTAFYVLGPERARRYCAEHPGVGMVLVAPGAGPGGVEVHSAGLADGVFRRVE